MTTEAKTGAAATAAQITAGAAKATARKPAAKTAAKRGASKPAAGVVAKLEPDPFVKRLADAMGEAQAIAKASENKDQGYKYASAEAILAAVRAPLFARAIVLTQTVTKLEVEKIASRGGTPGEKITAHVAFTFRDAYSEQAIESAWVGVGQDFGDKAIGKAMTSAVKTFVRGTWLLPTEHDDPEKDAPKTPAWQLEAAPDALREVLAAMSDVIGRDNARVVLHNIGKTAGQPVPAIAVTALANLCAAWRVVTQDQIAAAQQAEHPDPPAPDPDLTEGTVAGARARADVDDLPDDATHADAIAAARAAAPKATAGSGTARARVTAPPVERDSSDDQPVAPMPGMTPHPVIPPDASPADATAFMRQAGCTCADPFAEPSKPDCPIAGHGSPLV